MASKEDKVAYGETKREETGLLKHGETPGSCGVSGLHPRVVSCGLRCPMIPTPASVRDDMRCHSYVG